MSTGQIVILNGVPRAGKSSIAAAIQESFPGIWMNLGVDHYISMTPPQLRPGIGLRPGGERPDLEENVHLFQAALFESVAVHARLGLSVVVDASLHESYSRPLDVLARVAKRLEGLPVLWVGVYCPLDTIMARRNAGHEGRSYVQGSSEDPIPAPVRRWHEAVYREGIYDLIVDTSKLSPTECAERIRKALE